MTRLTLLIGLLGVSLLASAAALAAGGIDATHLPIGDGKVSSSPKAGYVDACSGPIGGAGAFASGPWIHSDGTFDATTKAQVQGSVTWPSSFEITTSGSSVRI